MNFEELKKMNEECKRKNQKALKMKLPWEKKEYKKFMDYYNGSEEYRKKHNEYMTQKVNCPKCGFYTTRSYLSSHKKTNKCKKNYLLLKKKENMPIIKKKKELQDKLKGFRRRNQSIIINDNIF